MDKSLIEMLVCPRCHSELDWQISRTLDHRVEAARIFCRGCDAEYDVREGIGNFLLPDDERRDLWEQVEGGIKAYVRENPGLRRGFLDSPIEQLSPADQFLRAMLLEDIGRYEEARELEAAAHNKLYTPEYLACWESEIMCLLGKLPGSSQPVVDLASGRGYLVERLLRGTDHLVVATDFSLRVLRNNQARFQALGLSDRLSQLAFDARSTPFRKDSVRTLTTNLGIPNITHPGSLLEELRRIVQGGLFAITHFYPEDDRVNAQAIDKAGLSAVFFRARMVDHFEAAGWTIAVENTCRATARPTPESELLDGVRIDALPVVDTELEWCVLVCS